MMKLKFYIGMGAGGTWKQKAVHKGIAQISKPCTHVELVFSDGMSFSSEFGVGPRFKRVNYSHPERWIEVALPFITAEMEARIRRRAALLVELRIAGLLKYDSRGAVGSAFTGVDNAWEYFCSEVVYEVICREIQLPEKLNFKMHPQKLFEVMDVVCQAE